MDEVLFGRYRLIEVIGAGAMGTVYRAHDSMMERDVAIRVIADAFDAAAENSADWLRTGLGLRAVPSHGDRL